MIFGHWMQVRLLLLLPSTFVVSSVDTLLQMAVHCSRITWWSAGGGVRKGWWTAVIAK